MMRKMLAWILVSSVLCGGCAAQVAAPRSVESASGPALSVASSAPVAAKSHSDEAEALKAQLATASGQEVLHLRCEDFDGDGQQEAFGLVGNVANQRLLTGWFASANGTKQVTEQGHVSALHRENSTGNAMDVYPLDGGQKCVVFESDGTTSSSSFIFTVASGKPIQSPLTVMQFRQESNGDFTALYSTYGSQYMVMDGKKSFMGHTWNPYWFYWDGKEFQEYVGTEITIEALMGYDGAKEITEARLAPLNKEAAAATATDQEGKPMDLSWKILSAYRRDNGIINVNYGSDYATGGGRCCDNLRIDGNAVTRIDTPQPGLEGSYMASMLK